MVTDLAEAAELTRTILTIRVVNLDESTLPAQIMAARRVKKPFPSSFTFSHRREKTDKACSLIVTISPSDCNMDHSSSAGWKIWREMFSRLKNL